MRCWAEININNLYSNIDEIEKIVPKEKIIAVIKADAYGHGMLKICDALIKKGIKNLYILTSYFVPNNLSPASPSPGTMYPSSFNFSSNAAI